MERAIELLHVWRRVGEPLRCSSSERFVAIVGDYDIVRRLEVECCTRPSRTRAAIHLDYDGHAADGGKGDKTVRRRRARM